MKRVVWVFILLAMALNVDAIDTKKMVKKILKGSSDGGEQVVSITKYKQFTSLHDRFIRYVDYDVDGLKTKDAFIQSAKVRQYMDIHTNESTFFLFLSVGHDKRTEIIAKEDLIKVLDAVKLLKTKCKEDVKSGKPIKCFYVTDDGFKIGYNVKGDTASWFFTIEGEEQSFKEDFDFEQSLKDIRTRIEALKTEMQ